MGYLSAGGNNHKPEHTFQQQEQIHSRFGDILSQSIIDVHHVRCPLNLELESQLQLGGLVTRHPLRIGGFEDLLRLLFGISAQRVYLLI